MSEIKDQKRHPPLSWDLVGMVVALSFATKTHCWHHAVGCCVLSERHRIVGAGYNGAVAGDDHCDETAGCAKKNGRECRGVHAEINTILNTEHPERLRGGTLYTTVEPCYDCAKAIVQAGIVRVVFLKKYVRVPSASSTHTTEHNEVAELFERRGVVFEQFPLEEIQFPNLEKFMAD